MTAWQLFFALLLFIAFMVVFLPPKTHSFTRDILKERRESITSRRLNPIERLTVRVRTIIKNAGFSMRTYFILTVAAFFAGTGAGTALFGGGQLGLATGAAFLPLPYIYMLMRGQTTARKETENLENAMSIITNAYMGCNDIVESFYGYVRERNRQRDPSQTDVTPFDEFVTEVTLINPDVERGLYILEAKIRNYHFSEWVKMLQMCNRNHDLKFALPPIVKAMGDANICHYCGGKVILTEATDVFEQGEGKIYLCTNCNAYVSCHKGTNRPMGKLANAVLRMKRREVHRIFDEWWIRQGMSRSQAYKWLAEQMNLSRRMAHIALFDMEACEQVLSLCRKNLKNKKEAS